MAIPAGFRLGPYEILSAVGSGGMGDVYRAKDTRLDRTVAIKTLRQHMVADADLRDRFEREARIIAKLNHPYICILHDVGKQGDLDYLVMEYLEGATLASRLLKGRLSLDEVLAYGSQLADALIGAHAQGITHRDLKPGNVMIVKFGVKVLDFGLARLHSRADETLTAGNGLMGTPAYMAPEQLAMRDCDSRTDIYALGLILCEMASGRRTAVGEKPKLDGLPEKLAHVVERCLASEPDDRWQTAKDLKAELTWAIKAQAHSEPARANSQAHASFRWYAAGTALLFAVLLLGGWIGLRYRAQGSEVATSLSPDASLLTIASYTGTERSAAISPDGKFFAFVSNRGGASDIWVRQISGGEPVQITHDPIGEQDLVYSWDGEFIYYSTVETVPTIMKVGVLGGTPQKVVSGARWPAPSPDGRRLAYGAISRSATATFGDALVVASENGSQPKTITNSGDMRVQFISWSPDGNLIAFADSRGLFSRYSLNVTDPDGRQQTKLAEFDVGLMFGTSWTGDSRQVVYAYDSAAAGSLGINADIWMKPIDGGPARRLTINPRGGFRSVRVSRDLKRLIGEIADVDYEVWRAPLMGDPASSASAAVRVLESGWAPMWIQLSKGILLFNSPATGERNLWTMPIDASAVPRQITFASGSHITHASLSPDGTRVAFVLVSAGNGQIWVANADGSGMRQLTHDDSTKSWPFWSPDEKWIMFAVQVPGSAQLWKMPSDGGPSEQFTRDGGLRGDWSPNGDRIAYDVDNVVRIAEASTGKVLREISLKGGIPYSPIWSPDGKLISMHGEASIWTVEPNSGEPKLAVQFPAGYTYNFRPAWTSDGRSLVVNKQLSTSRVVLLQNY